MADRHPLRRYYIATTFLCAFMAMWILFVPSTALEGYHDKIPFFSIFEKARDEMRRDTPVLPNKVLTKYDGHTAVNLSHVLPSAIWAIIIPFQLHAGFRKQYRKIHRMMGYLFLGCCALMVAGVVMIVRRGLLYENFLNDDGYGDGGSAGREAEIRLSADLVLIVLLKVWFVYTACMALYNARRKPANYALHQKWFVRHVASGIWVAIQRLIVVFMLPTLESIDFSTEQFNFIQRHLFGKAVWIGVAITIPVGEHCVRVLESGLQRPRNHQKQN